MYVKVSLIDAAETLLCFPMIIMSY